MTRAGLRVDSHKATATDSFDYESKTWGGHEVRVSPIYLGALRLKYCLEDLESVRGQVLEVGCGAGGMARAIKSYRPDLDVYGSDISRSAIEVAKGNPGGVTFDLGNAYDLPYKADRFDAVVMFDVLEHLDGPDRAISEIRRVLRPGGLFHLFVPCEGELHTLHGLLNRMGWRAKERYGGHIQQLRRSDVDALFAQKGFKVHRARWSGHLFNQIVDVAYFSALNLRGSNVPTSVEGYLQNSGSSLASRSIGALKSLVAVVSFHESRALGFLPGSGAHLTARRQPRDITGR